MSNFESTEIRKLQQGKVFLAGHRGMVGSAIGKLLESEDCENVVTRSRDELDLTDQKAVSEFMRDEKPEYVFLAAAKVGGIHANNTFPADFITDNLQIATNVVQSVIRRQCTAPVISWEFLHLPEARAPADGRRGTDDGPTGTDKRTLCHCQNCRYKNLRVVQPSAWHRLSQHHADEPLWTGRQFSPRKFTRTARADPAIS